jgi:uncharacterized protein YkwD
MTLLSPTALRLLFLTAVIALAGAIPTAADARQQPRKHGAAHASKRVSHHARKHARRRAHRRVQRRPVVHRAPTAPARPATPVVPAAPPAACTNVDTMPGATTPAVTRSTVLCLLNRERAAAGLVALSENPRLDAAAQGHSDDMVANHYFEHTSPTGSTMTARIFASGYVTANQAWTLGENIAWGTGSFARPGDTMVAWMNSPHHRDNILNPQFREVGIGVATAPPFPNGTGGTPAGR